MASLRAMDGIARDKGWHRLGQWMASLGPTMSMMVANGGHGDGRQ